MVLPVITYCSNLHLVTTKYQDERLESLERRGSAIVGKAMVAIKNFQTKCMCDGTEMFGQKSLGCFPKLL